VDDWQSGNKIAGVVQGSGQSDGRLDGMISHRVVCFGPKVDERLTMDCSNLN